MFIVFDGQQYFEQNRIRTSPTTLPLVLNRQDESVHIEENVVLPKKQTVILYKSVVNVRNKEEFDQIMQKRIEKINHVCQQIQKSKHLEENTKLHNVSLQNGVLLWCPVRKATSSNWNRYLVDLADKSIKKDVQRIFKLPINQAEHIFPRKRIPSLRALETKPSTKKMFITRHPFDRLLGSFRRKLEKHSPDFNQIEKKIVDTYRKKAMSKYPPDHFTEENNYGSPFFVEGRDSDSPLWWEFIQFVLDTPPDKHNAHWKSPVIHCSVCEFTYNYILHFENIAQEEKHMINIIDERKVIKKKWSNNNERRELTKEELIATYYDLLTDQEILRLYKLFENDFKMFDYQFQFRGLKLNVD